MGNYCVYRHSFPNGKHYIGISKDAEHRWRNGKGYDSQPKIAKAIAYYGWENIDHVIICNGLTLTQAQKLERELIDAYDSIEHGYNVSIGGGSVLATYLNPHVMEMIRASNDYDKKYGYTKLDDDIVSVCEKSKYIKQNAEIFNRIDEILQSTDNEKLQWRYHYNKDMTIDAYWCLMSQLIEIELGKRTDVIPYTQLYYDWIFG